MVGRRPERSDSTTCRILPLYVICQDLERGAPRGPPYNCHWRRSVKMEPAVQRPIVDLVESLRRHVRLLREYDKRAFDDGNDDYLGEIAATLRLLSIAKGHNVALLVSLMKVCKVKARIKRKG